jgi:PPP family 3-phenylpropionic acid transporter
MIALYVLVTALGVALGVLYPFLSVILADFGFGPAEIGLISSLGALAFTIAVPGWGHLADVRFGRPRTLQVCAVGGGLAVAALLLPWPPLLIVVWFLLFWVFESSWQPLTDAITVNALRGRDYARVRLFTSLGFAVAAVLAGQLYDRAGYTPAFALFAGAALVMVIASASLPDVRRADLEAHRRATEARPDEPARASGRRVGRTLSFGSSGVAMRVAPRLRLVLLASGLLHIGVISGFTFLALRIEDLGGSPGEVALSSGASAAAEIPAMFVMGGLATRFGLRAIFTVSALLYAACFAAWTVLDAPLAIVATRALTGIAFSGVVVGIVLTIAVLLPAELQGTGQALFQLTAFGVAAIIANVVGGVVYEAVGHAWLFGASAVLAVVAAAVGWMAFPARGPVRATSVGASTA